MKLDRRLSATTTTTANINNSTTTNSNEHSNLVTNGIVTSHLATNTSIRMQHQSSPLPVVPSSLVAKHTMSSPPNLRAMSSAYNDHTEFSQPSGGGTIGSGAGNNSGGAAGTTNVAAVSMGTGATILSSTTPMSYLMGQRTHNQHNTNNSASAIHTPFARPIVSQPQPPQPPPPPSMPPQETGQDHHHHHQTQAQQSSFRPLPINYPRLGSTPTAMPQMPSNLRLEDSAFRRPWPAAPTIPHSLPSNPSSAMHHHHPHHSRFGTNRHAPLRHLPGVGGTGGSGGGGGGAEGGGTSTPGETGGNMPFVPQWLGEVDTSGSGHHSTHGALHPLTTGDTEPGAGNTIDGGMFGGEYGDEGLRRFANRSRLPRSRPRPNTLTEHEKRARHNAHTKSSRLRIDRGLERLKDALKKARPEVKLNKKADIVDAAVNYVLETYEGVGTIAPNQHHHHIHHHQEQHDSSLSG